MLCKDRKFYVHFFSLLGPLVLQNVVLFLVGLLDNLMVGRYSEAALAGVSIANQVQFMLQMLSGGISTSAIILGTQYWGQGRDGDVRKILGVGFKAQVVLGLIFFVPAFFFPAQLMRLITPEAGVVAEAVLYLRVICFTYVFFCLTGILLASMQCVETVKIGFVVTTTSLLINLVLNYALIYGNLGAPEMGIRGAAIATLVARVAEFAIILWYVLCKDQKLHLRLRDFLRRDAEFLGDYLRNGLPIIGANFLWGAAMSCQAAILGHLSPATEILAANGIAASIFQIFSVANGAMSNTATIIIGKTVGEGDRDKVKLYSRTLQVLFLGMGFLSGLGLFLCKGPVLSFYDADPVTWSLANGFLTVLSVTLVGTCYQAPTLTGIVRGGGDTKFVLINDMIFQFFIVLPLSFLAAFVLKLPPVSVYMVLKSDQILKCTVAVVKVNRYRWIKKLTRDDPEQRAQAVQ